MLMPMIAPGSGTATGISYCSFGELLQGILLEDNVDFLVTLPIQMYSVSRFVPDYLGTHIVTHPDIKTKSAAMARRILRHYGKEMGGTIYIDCDIPSGKGLSSSSADLLATARAIETYMGIELPLGDLCSYMSDIEPTDGVMYPESVVYLQRKGILRNRLGRLSDLTILALDEGGTIDTLEYHRRALAGNHNLQHRTEFNELLDEMTQAFQQHDLTTIGKVSTRSAFINQKVNPKKNLETVHAVCQQTGGIGLVTAHSGTCLGILYDTRREDYPGNIACAETTLQQYGQTRIYDTIK